MLLDEVRCDGKRNIWTHLLSEQINYAAHNQYFTTAGVYLAGKFRSLHGPSVVLRRVVGCAGGVGLSPDGRG